MSEEYTGFEASPAEAPRIVVLISGNGSNLQAMIEAQTHDELGGEIAAVISNRSDAYGLERAREAGIPAVVLPQDEYESREAYDGALIKVIERHEPSLIVLAGFMRILSPIFVHRFYGRLINIHPSLLPAYKGLHTHRRVLEDGVATHGVSVHFVSDELDGGPIIMQAEVDVESSDTEQTLAIKVQQREHLIYPIAVRWVLEGRLRLEGDKATFDGIELKEGGMRLSHADALSDIDDA
ncbi:phosphoribosylglycinamide formyltransferase [Carnimonas nigrificans]|uniref:phosphoribosylglycinamide formyltransferase n=1 Tax=Carnimonas nigrificans TaxID=64323 RepID=UPI0004702E4C|nr:phosphoribosylglycinamide formyltransferase [Carnimonas nigrificans]